MVIFRPGAIQRRSTIHHKQPFDAAGPVLGQRGDSDGCAPFFNIGFADIDRAFMREHLGCDTQVNFPARTDKSIPRPFSRR